MIAQIDRTVGCLFCGNENGRFESEEHTIPKSLGNDLASGLVETEIVIPPGEICDKCNEQRLSRVDNALIEWGPISVFRSLALIKNRKGALIDATVGTDWDIHLNVVDRRLFQMNATADTSTGSRRDDVARALCKIAVETRWLTDPDDARSRRWDELAAAAIGGPLPPSLSMGLLRGRIEHADLTPACTVQVGPDPEQLGMVCDIRVVGMRLLLLLRARTELLPGTDWWTVDPTTGALAGPNELSIMFGGAATTAKQLTSLNPEPEAKRASRLPTASARKRIYVQQDQLRRRA